MFAPVLVLLPPSERKLPARRRRGATAPAPLDLAALSWPQLAAARERVLEAAAELSADPGAAAAVLGTGPSLAGDVARNTTWRTEPAQPVASCTPGCSSTPSA